MNYGCKEVSALPRIVLDDGGCADTGWRMLGFATFALFMFDIDYVAWLALGKPLYLWRQGPSSRMDLIRMVSGIHPWYLPMASTHSIYPWYCNSRRL